ncbi:MAG TPA: molybdopterin biosynthesis protein [Desulfosalsimonadaceae bacterium]|nr:molybdopterin biosynthesis protein [Desulfosalsimonadaceae bacterium]
MSSHRRNIYLQKKTLEDARKTVIEAFAEKSPGKQWISTLDGAGRVLAEPVFAAVSSPNFHAAAMDGVAVKAANTFGAAETRPLNLQLGETAFPVNTGHIIPEGTDAVIMIEQINWVENDWIEIEAPVYPWQNVRKMGEDIVATELVFPRNHKITPHCLGAIITAGISSVCVWKKPTVLILPTGSELVDLTAVDPQALPKGKVIDSNSHMLGQMVEACGGTYRRHDLVADVTKAIREAIENANTDDIDLILILGGSSAGSEDYARAVIEELGSVLVHGVTMMPGKPVIAGQINGKPVFGMPGYPVSAIIAFEQLVQPIVYQMLHQTEPEARRINALPTRKLASKLGVEEFIRIKLGKVGDNIVATPLPRGAGCITSFTEADGIIRVPNAVEGVDANTPVPVELLRPLSSIYNTLVCVGSHDNTLDILSDMVREKSRQTTLSSSHVGSMGGLMAIKKGLCHIAGTHLLDTSDGNYNISYIKRYLPKRSVHLIHLVKRDQGLIVQPGNPKNIKNIKDLARPDVQFINRQGGSGTRILLDYRLSELGLKPEAISGYSNEEYTHMAVAVAVLSGAADVGLGIHAAAKALNLEFIPVVTESYELVIPDEFIEKPEIRLLLDIIGSAEFKSRVTALGGYHLENTGTWVWKNC